MYKKFVILTWCHNTSVVIMAISTKFFPQLQISQMVVLKIYCCKRSHPRRIPRKGRLLVVCYAIGRVSRVWRMPHSLYINFEFKTEKLLWGIQAYKRNPILFSFFQILKLKKENYFVPLIVICITNYKILHVI